jgi:hypothetical protein
MTKHPTTSDSEAKLRQKLAAIEHERWADWQRYVHKVCLDNMPELGGNLIIPQWAVENWTRQINTNYADLSDEEKASDLRQVDRYWPLIEARLAQAEIKGAIAENKAISNTLTVHTMLNNRLEALQAQLKAAEGDST